MSHFTLQPRCWYALECVFADAHRHYSPIWISELHPRRTGASRLGVRFYHASYPEGVRDKTYELQVLHRASGFLLGRTLPATAEESRLILLEAISKGWLRTHFPELPIRADDDATLAAELDRLTARVP